MGKRGSALASLLDVQPDAFVKSGGGSYWIDCPKFTQCLPRGYKLEASDSNVGKRQKQAHHQEKPNDEHLKRDGTALIRQMKVILYGSRGLPRRLYAYHFRSPITSDTGAIAIDVFFPILDRCGSSQQPCR